MNIPGQYPPHRWYAAPVAIGMCLALAACGGSAPQADGNTQKPGALPSQSASSTPFEVPASPTADASPSAAPLLSGDAATSPACKMLSIDQVVSFTGLPVTEVSSLVGEDPSRRDNCTWYLDSKEIQASLSVSWRLHDVPPPGEAAYLRGLPKKGYGKAVPNLGDAATVDKHTVDAGYKRASFHVSLLTHAVVVAGIKQ